MKLKEMRKICKENKGKCEKCKLNCIDDWVEKKTTWCLINMKEDYIKCYKEEKAKNNDILAERIMNRYLELEKKYLKE